MTYLLLKKIFGSEAVLFIITSTYLRSWVIFLEWIKRQFMVKFSNLIGIETDFDLKFLIGFYFAFILWNLKYALFLNFFVIKFPFHLILINIFYENRHKLWVTTIWFSDNFSFKIDNWRLKEKLRSL